MDWTVNAMAFKHINLICIWFAVLGTCAHSYTSSPCPKFSYCSPIPYCPVTSRLRYDSRSVDYMSCNYSLSREVRIGVCCTDIAEDLYYDFDSYEYLLHNNVVARSRRSAEEEATIENEGESSEIPYNAPEDSSDDPSPSTEYNEGVAEGRAEHIVEKAQTGIATETSTTTTKADDIPKSKYPPMEPISQPFIPYSHPGIAYSGRSGKNFPKRRKMTVPTNSNVNVRGPQVPRPKPQPAKSRSTADTTQKPQQPSGESTPKPQPFRTQTKQSTDLPKKRPEPRQINNKMPPPNRKPPVKPNGKSNQESSRPFKPSNHKQNNVKPQKSSKSPRSEFTSSKSNISPKSSNHKTSSKRIITEKSKPMRPAVNKFGGGMKQARSSSSQKIKNAKTKSQPSNRPGRNQNPVHKQSSRRHKY